MSTLSVRLIAFEAVLTTFAIFTGYAIFTHGVAGFAAVALSLSGSVWGIQLMLDFVLALFFGFGLAFEVPIATIILIAIGFTTPKKLGEKRPYVIVGAFIIGMLLTPPDIISQVLLAFPMWILFEAGLIAAKIIFSDRNFEEDEDEEDDDEAEAETSPVAADHEPLTDEEMEAELDQAENDESSIDKK